MYLLFSAVEFFPTKDEDKINESSKHRKEMKKNILKATLVAAFGLIAGFNVYNSQKSDVMSELGLWLMWKHWLAVKKVLERAYCMEQSLMRITNVTIAAALVITIAELQLVADAKYLLVDNRKHFYVFFSLIFLLSTKNFINYEIYLSLHYY